MNAVPIVVSSAQSRYSKRVHESLAEIGDLPDVANPSRRRQCGDSLLLFLVTYFPYSTGLGLFSADHVRIIDRIEQCLRGGGRFVNAVYRGFAKTTITENSALWATLYGLRQFVAIYASDQPAANTMVESITRELCENELLLADFPEVCVAFESLQGKSQRCRFQTHSGVQTHIRMSAEYVVLPTVQGAPSQGTGAGCIIRAKGLTSASRGLSHKRPDGTKLRPDFAIVDDPQTDESARHATQCETRLSILRRGILKSAGHRKSIACVVNATVIEADDMIDQLLDHGRNPSWQGERVPMVRQWSEAHETLWQEYRRLRHSYSPKIPGDQQRAQGEATELYSANREAMDSGCIVSWSECYDRETELSAVQHAYNLFVDDPPDVFASECQCQPVTVQAEGLTRVSGRDVQQRVNGHERRVVPTEATRLTAFVDVHDNLLYWMICGFKAGFTGWIVDYSTYPEQPAAYFSKRDAVRTLLTLSPGSSTRDALLRGLETLTARLCGEWHRSDGGLAQIDRLGIDGGYNLDVVELSLRRAGGGARIITKGIGVKAGDRPFNERERKPGDEQGDNWFSRPERGHRLYSFDANAWKSFLHARLSTPITSTGALTLFGRSDADHRLVADHLTAETATRTEGRGRVVYEWRPLSGRDNHWLDCAVGCAVVASTLGITLEGSEDRFRPQRRKMQLPRAMAHA